MTARKSLAASFLLTADRVIDAMKKSVIFNGTWLLITPFYLTGFRGRSRSRITGKRQYLRNDLLLN